MRAIILRLGVLLAILPATGGALAEDAPYKPGPGVAPDEVIAIQLMALQSNDTPEKDAGIRQVWAFAHPDNRKMTGPLERFTAMIKSPNYGAMIDHRSHTITEMNRARDWVQYKVMMEDSRGRVLTFLWVVKKVTDPSCDGCWMTSAVSAPVPSGQGS